MRGNIRPGKRPGRKAHVVDAWQVLRGEVHMAGDCLAPRTAEALVLEGLKAGCAL